jgi:hypothetical protein
MRRIVPTARRSAEFEMAGFAPSVAAPGSCACKRHRHLAKTRLGACRMPVSPCDGVVARGATTHFECLGGVDVQWSEPDHEQTGGFGRFGTKTSAGGRQRLRSQCNDLRARLGQRSTWPTSSSCMRRNQQPGRYPARAVPLRVGSIDFPTARAVESCSRKICCRGVERLHPQR